MFLNLIWIDIIKITCLVLILIYYNIKFKLLFQYFQNKRNIVLITNTKDFDNHKLIKT